jgi:hypothetical protein
MTTLVQPPWYKQFWPWALMAGPVTVIVAGFITLGLALHTPESLVVDDYYKQGKAIHLSLQRDRQAQALGLQALLQWDGDRVKVSVESQHNTNSAWPQQLELLLSHPVDAAQDQRILLRKLETPRTGTTAQAVYSGATLVPKDQLKYEFILQDLNGQWRVLSLKRGALQRDVLLLPSRL